MIGSKTVGMLFLCAFTLVVALRMGTLRPERLLSTRPDAAFVVGVLATAVALFLYRFFSLSSRSPRYLRFSTDRTLWEDESHLLGTETRRVVLGDNQGNVFDFSPRFQLLLCFIVAAVVGFSTLHARAVSLLIEFPQAVTRAGSTWCPDEAEEEAKSAVPEVDPNAPGCALLRRAYELGYAKSLGDCEAKKKEEEATNICTLRQRDEPAFHYAFRLLTDFSEKSSGKFGPSAVAAMWSDFQERQEQLGHLYENGEQVMASTPHASHHLWTNLPKPENAVPHRLCTEAFRQLPYRLPEAQRTPSNVLEHVWARLLFETRYEPAAGYCREYTIHWDAPVDACEKLAASPAAFLEESDALAEVKATLHRVRLGDEDARLKSATSKASSSMQPTSVRRARAESVMSFSCYMEGGAAKGPQRRSTPFRFEELALKAEAVRVPEQKADPLAVERLHALATLLAPSFHYGALLSEAGLSSQNASEGMSQAFAGGDYVLSRAHSLASVDVFLDSRWLGAQDDLLEIYPYHVHLKNFVNLFRTQYRSEKGRL